MFGLLFRNVATETSLIVGIGANARNTLLRSRPHWVLPGMCRHHRAKRTNHRHPPNAPTPISGPRPIQKVEHRPYKKPCAPPNAAAILTSCLVGPGPSCPRGSDCLPGLPVKNQTHPN